jgi:zinc transport system permease protein
MAGALAGLLLGALGVYVVLRRMVFLAAALSQAAGLGVALSFYVGARVEPLSGANAPSMGAALFTGLAALPFFTRVRGERRDGWMGLTWLVGAAGALAVGSRIADAEDISSLLFGSAVVVLPEQFYTLIAMAVAVLGLHAWWVRGFVLASLDPDGARTRRVPVRVLDLALLVTLALSISFTTRVLGALPVFAFSVLPALAALRLSRTVPRGMLVAAVVGAASGFLGYLAAFRFNLPVGASQALVAAAFVALAEIAHRIRGR